MSDPFIRRPRRFMAMIVLSMTLLLTFATSVQAVSRSSNGGTQFACDGGLCITAKFYANWTAVQGRSEGQNYWMISNLSPWGVLPQARNAAAVLGVKPMSGIKVEALNSANVVVRTITLTQGVGCTAGAAHPNDLVYKACRTYIEVPLTVTKLRFTIKIEDPFVFGVGWLKTWSASID
jgi:hypothetical protein